MATKEGGGGGDKPGDDKDKPRPGETSAESTEAATPPGGEVSTPPDGESDAEDAQAEERSERGTGGAEGTGQDSRSEEAAGGMLPTRKRGASHVVPPAAAARKTRRHLSPTKSSGESASTGGKPKSTPPALPFNPMPGWDTNPSVRSARPTLPPRDQYSRGSSMPRFGDQVSPQGVWRPSADPRYEAFPRGSRGPHPRAPARRWTRHGPSQSPSSYFYPPPEPPLQHTEVEGAPLATMDETEPHRPSFPGVPLNPQPSTSGHEHLGPLTGSAYDFKGLYGAVGEEDHVFVPGIPEPFPPTPRTTVWNEPPSASSHQPSASSLQPTSHEYLKPFPGCAYDLDALYRDTGEEDHVFIPGIPQSPRSSSHHPAASGSRSPRSQTGRYTIESQSRGSEVDHDVSTQKGPWTYRRVPQAALQNPLPYTPPPVCLPNSSSHHRGFMIPRTTTDDRRVIIRAPRPTRRKPFLSSITTWVRKRLTRAVAPLLYTEEMPFSEERLAPQDRRPAPGIRAPEEPRYVTLPGTKSLPSGRSGDRQLAHDEVPLPLQPWLQPIPVTRQGARSAASSTAPCTASAADLGLQDEEAETEPCEEEEPEEQPPPRPERKPRRDEDRAPTPPPRRPSGGGPAAI